ncbi:hypothetical protein VQL36_16330 [Chengkuizengella sp. SCS-71B]|uniref:hypothetical protein n=1 Tax=Chengkuizengella sp. SCS-71B TaxID=3115290 RepID=UPI0032C23EAF
MRWLMKARNMTRGRGIWMSLIAVSAGAAAFGVSRRRMKSTAGTKLMNRILR